MTLHDQGFWAINAGHWRRFGRDGFQVTDLSIGGVYQPFQRFPVFFPGSKVPTVTVLVHFVSCWVTYSIQILSGCLSNTGPRSIDIGLPCIRHHTCTCHSLHSSILSTEILWESTVSYLDSTPIARFQAALHRSDIRKVKFCGLTNSWLDHPTQHMFLGHRTRPCWISTVRRRRNCNFANCHQKKRNVFSENPTDFLGKSSNLGCWILQNKGHVFF